VFCYGYLGEVKRLVSDRESIEYEGHVVHTTDLAVLFYVDEEGEEIWFPLSECELDGSETLILVPGWLARAKGLGR
jgi:hypothetical protein